MKRALTAATAYVVALFLLGFVLGTVRVLLIAPRIGDFGASLMEIPLMLTAAYYSCHWALRRWQVSSALTIRLLMVLWFLMLLALFETLVGTAIFGRTWVQQWAALTTPAGLMGIMAQVIAALMPLFIRDSAP